MSLVLEFENEQNEVELPEGMERKLEQLLQLAGVMESIPSGEVSVTFVTDEEIRELNKQYRSIDKATDVLSFSMWEASEQEPVIHYGDLAEDFDGGNTEGSEAHDGDEILELPEDPIGDIVISAATAKRQSEDYGHSLEREIGFLFVHGFLHLIGYDHEDEAAERVMTEKQENVLQQAGLFR